MKQQHCSTLLSKLTFLLGLLSPHRFMPVSSSHDACAVCNKHTSCIVCMKCWPSMSEYEGNTGRHLWQSPEVRYHGDIARLVRGRFFFFFFFFCVCVHLHTSPAECAVHCHVACDRVMPAQSTLVSVGTVHRNMDYPTWLLIRWDLDNGHLITRCNKYSVCTVHIALLRAIHCPHKYELPLSVCFTHGNVYGV